MQFSTIQSEVHFQVGTDPTDTDSQTLVKRWINIAQQDVASRENWKWLYAREAVATVADKTAGTVSVNSGTTAVTGSGTSITSADVNKFIQFQGADQWYRISAQSSSTAFTIANAYAPTTNLSAGTYVIRQFFYSLSSSVERILGVVNQNANWRLVEIDYRTFDILRPNPDSTGASGSFLAFGYDSSGNVRFTPYPFPSDARLFEVRYIKRLSDLSADGDLSEIPARDHQVLVYGATAFGFMFRRQVDMAQAWNEKYEDKIAQMARVNRTSEDNFRIMESIDRTGHVNQVRWPEDYPETRRLFG